MMAKRLRRTALLALFTLAAAGPGRALPKELRATLDREYSGWKFATLAAEYHGLMAENDSPEWLQGDYDSDGKVDYVVRIVRPTVPKPTKMTVVLLRRADGFERLTLESGEVDDYTFLHPVRKGEELFDFEADRSFPSPTDAITIVIEEKAAVTYLFEKGQFRKIISGD